MRRDLERPIRRFMRALAHLVLFVVALPGRGLAQPGAAGDIVQARELFVQAMEERDSGNAKDALAKFKAAHSSAEKACEGKQGDARRDCMRHEMCAQAKDPAKCEARAKAARERREQKK